MLKITRRTVPLEMEGTVNRLNSELEAEKAKTAEYELALAGIAEETTAKAHHSVGEYLTVNNVFCEVIEPISVGEIISFGSNVKAANIGSALAELKKK